MGIRFKCPAGHQLHVKSFLAGKKGVCPDCGIRVRIPLESTIKKDGSPVTADLLAAVKDDDEDTTEIPPETPAMKSGEDLRDAAVVPKGTAPPQAFSPAMPVAQQPQPVPQAAVQPAMPAAAQAYPAPAAAMPARPVAAVPVGVAPMATAAAAPVGMGSPMAMPAAPGTAAAIPMGVRPAAVPVAGYGQPAAVAAVPVTARPALAPTGPMPPGLVDPITEAPHASWYVRPASGGQYGPARGDMFRQWMSQGRVPPDSLVWREGWADWRSASAVFPELGGLQPGMVAPQPAAGMGFGGESAAQSTANYKSRRRNSTMFGVGMIVFLGFVCVVLIGVLIFVLPKIQ